VSRTPLGGPDKETIVATGTVKWFDATKGYGFIVEDKGGGEVFVRPQDVQQAGLQQLDAGQKVIFEPVTTPTGNVAASEIKSAG
jgi:CspA family cold shock protein